MKRQNQRIVVLGEVLSDAFPGGDSLGGAPFNFAWHLRWLGRHPLLVSMLGDDPLCTAPFRREWVLEIEP